MERERERDTHTHIYIYIHTTRGKRERQTEKYGGVLDARWQTYRWPRQKTCSSALKVKGRKIEQERERKR